MVNRLRGLEVCLWASMLAAAVSMGFTARSERILDLAFAGVAPSAGQLQQIDRTHLATAGLCLITFLVAVATFVRWLQAVWDSDRLDREGLSTDPRWPVRIWFVPIVGVWQGYLVMHALVIAAGRGADRRLSPHSAPRLAGFVVLGWWLCSVIMATVVVLEVLNVQPASQISDFAQVWPVQRSLDLANLRCVLTIVTGVLFWIVVRYIGRTLTLPRR